MKIINLNKQIKSQEINNIFKTKDIISYEDIIFKNKDIFHYDSKEIHKLDLYTYKIYNNLLIELTKILNAKFNLNYSKKNYELLIGYWLIHYIQQAYYKYKLLSVLSIKFPKSFFLIPKSNFFFL
mgnify:CR=1 FL=1